MYAFSFHKPQTVEDAVRLFGECDDPRYLSGGHTLLPSMKLRLAAPSDLIELNAIESLKGISVEGDKVIVGAGTRHGAVAKSAEVRAALPALADLAGMIGDFQVRNRGTLGGSIANADPAADYPAAVVGLNATVRTDRREIAADDYFTDLFETALEEGEIVTAVSFPKPVRAAYMKFPNPASRYAIVGVFVAQTSGGVRVAVTGAGPCVFRVAEMETALSANFAPDAVADILIPDGDLNSDIHAAADYRAHLLTVMAKRAVAKAIEAG